MRFLPLFLDLSSETIALVGNSAAAMNRLHLLRSAGATVRWFSDDVDVSDRVAVGERTSRSSRDRSRPIRCKLTFQSLSPLSSRTATRATKR